MNIDISKDKEVIPMRLCDVPVGWVFKFKRGSENSMLKLSDGCGICELGGAWQSSEVLDMEIISKNQEEVLVLGQLQTLGIV